MLQLDCRVARISGNSALVVLVPGHLDISLLSPGCSPGVLDEPIVSSTVSSVSNGEDTVVKHGRRAGRFIINTRFVELEAVLGSINANGDGPNGGNSLQEGALITNGNRNVSSAGGSNGVLVERAGSELSCVGVRLLRINPSIFNDVLESSLRETSFASHVAVRCTVNKVLLRQ